MKLISFAEEKELLSEVIQSLEHSGSYVTKKQLTGLASLIGQGLKDKSRENRLAVMNCLIGEAYEGLYGYPLKSFKGFNSTQASALIDYFLEEGSKPWRLSENGRYVIEQAEMVVKAGAEALPESDTDQALSDSVSA